MSLNKMRLLDFKADVNRLNVYGESPLVTAIRTTKNDAVIGLLLERGAEVNDLTNSHNTPLLVLLRERNDCSVDTVKLLLANGADINCVDKCGCSPLSTAIRNSKNEGVIRVLVERGAVVNDLRNLNNIPLSVLFWGRKYYYSIDTVKLLLANGADVNCLSEHGWSCLVGSLRPKAYFYDQGAIVQALLEGGANVNAGNPLSKYLDLTLSSCSVDIVKLFLRYNANVNSKNSSGDSPLMCALKQSRSEEIIRILLEGGADGDTLDRFKKSPLCIAFSRSSNDIVKLLLDAGSSPSACKYHASALHCATDHSYSGLREDILMLLLQTNVNVNRVNGRGQSLMCFALQHGAKAHDIRLLLDSGASLNVCELHSSPLRCATSALWAPLREDLIQLLLDNGASVGDTGLKVLQKALHSCKYETGAIQLLLDLPGMDAYVLANECNNSLLHLAVQNPYCKLEAVKLLINRKAQVHSTNQSGDTPLHCAIRNGNESCNPRVIKFLLQNDSPVNAENKSNETPLMLAVKERRPAGILKELLMSGAHIGNAKFCHGNIIGPKCELLEFLAKQWERCDDSITVDSYSILLKYFLLQNPECNIRDFQRSGAKPYCKVKLVTFMNKCLRELEKMDSLQVGHGHTFRTFVSRNCPAVEKMYDVNQILICLMKNTFPVYFDVISARIGRSIMEAEVKKLQVYTNKTRPDMGYRERIHLNSDVVFKISQYLSNDDLLNFILVFYKPVNQNKSGEADKDDSLLGKRNSEPSSKLHKHPRHYP